MPRYFLLTLLFLFPIYAFAQKINAQDSICARSHADAKADMAGGEIRYYFFGIVSPDQGVVQRLAQEYGVQAATVGCMVPPGTMCYNAEIDRHIKQKYGKTVSELMQELKSK